MKRKYHKIKKVWKKPKWVKKDINVFSGPCAGGMTHISVCDPPIELS
ncbi:MAG: hypothetical protein N3B13_00650 [Deltaproteobacteria bacterium]|nr:hypothetical protein [Deltaproteobacteria bacterium]